MSNVSDHTVLQKFQERISDLKVIDETCLRFLIAREQDLDNSEDMLRKSMQWRQDNNIENIKHLEQPGYLISDLPYRYMGIGRNDSPVFWFPMGLWKTRYWIEQGKKSEIVNYAYNMLESIQIQVVQTGKPATVILGTEELSYHRLCHVECIRLLNDISQTLEQNYPEIIQNIVIVNAPWIFNIAYNIIQSIASRRTLNKIQIFGTDKSKWMPVLQELCFQDSIPKEYL